MVLSFYPWKVSVCQKSNIVVQASKKNYLFDFHVVAYFTQRWFNQKEEEKKLEAAAAEAASQQKQQEQAPEAPAVSEQPAAVPAQQPPAFTSTTTAAQTYSAEQFYKDTLAFKEREYLIKCLF